MSARPMELIRIWLPLEMLVTSQVSLNMAGMNGVAIENARLGFPITKKYLVTEFHQE